MGRSLETGASVALDPAQRHHLEAVLRRSPGDPVEVVDTDGQCWEATITSWEPPAVAVGPRVSGQDASPSVDLEIWVPVLKGGRTDQVIRQLTELGASTLVPYLSQRTVARPSPERAAKQVDRWQRICAEATRQCGREDLPEVRLIRGLPEEGPGIFFWGAGGQSARDVLLSVSGGSLRVLTGPEGGLSPEEAAHLEALGWTAAHLGPRVLRAETAAVVAATLALHALEEGGY